MVGASSTREHLLDVLKRRGGDLTTRELADAVSLSAMAVFRQLSALEAEGLVYSHRCRQGKGRPAKHYFLTQRGHESFERTYSELALDLLKSLKAADSPGAVDAVLEHRRKARLASGRKRVNGTSLESRVRALAAVLTEEGFMADAERVEDGVYRLRLMNCAVERVARQFPGLCSCEAMLIEELTGAEVTRERHLLRQDAFCSYLIRDRDA